ncbi:MAG: hypothetical protein CMK74_20990 [Pseudomonadales bacterium]|nr:hypothetical protein [Pseudomonadales bacterium]|tara:strand:+ start:491 stop:1045 length:555 start_codon:yes stop_codon:yes gene_type:complete
MANNGKYHLTHLIDSVEVGSPPVVSRCTRVHETYWGYHLRGVVFMCDGSFLAGVEYLFEQGSLTALAFKLVPSELYFTIDQTGFAAAAVASDLAGLVPEPKPVAEDHDITKTVQSVESFPWRFINDLDEVKTHLGELHEPGQERQFYAGIELSHRGGESDIEWKGPFATRELADAARVTLESEG